LNQTFVEHHYDQFLNETFQLHPKTNFSGNWSIHGNTLLMNYKHPQWVSTNQIRWEVQSFNNDKIIVNTNIRGKELRLTYIAKLKD
jgi:hypothetical protein